MITAQTKIVRNDRVVYQELAPGQGAVLLHLDTAHYHGLNPVGALIWDLLGTEGATLGEVLAGVRAAVPDAPDAVERDVREFIQALADRDVVRTT
ncbi:MAG: PqqD family protein [Armatimonadota bacterium]|nr:PqqD family protein [Armatimonadota bacterium]